MKLFPSSWAGFLLRIAGFYLLLVAVVAVFQRRLIYHPTHRGPETWEEGSPLKPWTVAGNIIGCGREVAHPAAVWLMLHGNAGQAADRNYALALLPPDAACYVLEYPGYGTRAGCPTRASIDRAAAEAYDRLTALYPDTPIALLGESIGSGPAAALASRTPPPARIALVVPFDTLASVAAEHMPFLPAGLLLLDRWDNVAALRNYRGRLDIYGACEDEVIPVRHARRLAQALPGAAFHEIPGGHNDWCDPGTVDLRHETSD